VHIENFDFVSLAADRTTITVYKLPAQAAVVDISLIFFTEVSLAGVDGRY
jgi:hypothetical protein